MQLGPERTLLAPVVCSREMRVDTRRYVMPAPALDDDFSPSEKKTPRSQVSL